MTPEPWLTFPAIDWLNENLAPDWRVFEWGSGGSTVYFAEMLPRGRVISIEHDPEWHLKTMEALVEEMQLSRVRLYLIPKNNDYYLNIVRGFGEYDLVLVDGRRRVDCIMAAIKTVRPGGYLMLDNSDRERYEDAVNMLSVWERTDFSGEGEGNGGKPWRTTLWRKPLR